MNSTSQSFTIFILLVCTIFAVQSIEMQGKTQSTSDISVEHFTCSVKKYGTPTEHVKVGDSIYVDKTNWKIESIALATNVKDTKGVGIVQTASVDASSTDEVIATFVSPSHIQYLLAVPNGNEPEWMKKAGWTKVDGGIVKVKNPENKIVPFNLYQKKYLPSVVMSMGPNKRDDGQMMFVLYKALANTADHGVVPHNAKPPVQKCQATGDPHWVAFDGSRFDFGKKNTWYHMLQSKDCRFDIQVLATKINGQLTNTAIRFDDDLVAYDHHKAQITKQIKNGGKTTVTNLRGNKYKISNSEFGIDIEVRPGWGGIYLFMENAFYMENSDGICGVAKNAYAKNKGNHNRNRAKECGGSGLHRDVPVEEKNKLWNLKDKWGTITKPIESTCIKDFCVDPNKELKPEDPEYPTQTKCAAPTGQKGEIIPNGKPDKECGAFKQGGECRGIGIDVIVKGLNACRKNLMKNPWKSDCDCMRDYCTTKLLPKDEVDDDKPCKTVEIIEGNIVKQSEYDYATLDFASPNGNGKECQATKFTDGKGQAFAHVPFGWEIVPKDDGNVDKILAKHSFGTKCILTLREEPYAMNGFKECGKHELYERKQSVYQCYAVKMCPSRVLIRRKSVQVLKPAKPSRIGWTCTVDNKEVATVGNRGFKGIGLSKWVDEQMRTPSSTQAKLPYELANENNLVINFARDADQNKYYMCMIGGNTQTGKTSSVETSIKTAPKYPIFWMAQDHITEKDNFLPILKGTELESKSVFPDGRKSHGWCIGPLDVSGRHCFTVEMKNAKDLKKLHLLGPNKDYKNPIKSWYSADLAKTVKMTFCPTVSDTSFGPGACPTSQKRFRL